MERLPEQTAPSFLRGGGEMGELTRGYDWSSTGLGQPGQWPQSLRTTLSNLLRSRVPTMLWWGPELIQFYNDAFQPYLFKTGAQTIAVGLAGKQYFSKKPQIRTKLLEEVPADGDSTWQENELISPGSGDKAKHVFKVFSYAAVLDDHGNPGGILLTCLDVNDQVEGPGETQKTQPHFYDIIGQAPVAIALTRGEDFVFTSISEPMLQVINQNKRQNVIGRKLFEVLPELVGQPLHDILMNVLATGETYKGTEVVADLVKDEVLQQHYFDINYSRLLSEDGTPSILHMSADVTQQVLARRKIEESEAKLRSIINSAPTAIGVFVGPDLIVENPNQLMMEVLGVGPEMEGKSFRKLVSELVEDGQKFIDLLDNVRATGELFEAQEVEVYFKADKKTKYFNISFIPLKDENGQVYAVLDVSVDVSQQLANRRRLLETETRFRNMVMQAPVAISIFRGKEHVIEVANNEQLRLWGRTAEQVMDRPLFEALPETVGQGLEEVLAGVFNSGQPFHAKELASDLLRGDRLTKVYFNFVYEALREEDGSVSGIMSVATEVTDQVLAGQQLKSSEAKFRSLLEEAPFATALYTGEELVINIVNDAMLQLWDKPATIVNKTLEEALPEITCQPFADLIKNVYQTGIEYMGRGEPVNLMINGKLQRGWYNFNYKPVRNEKGDIYGVLHMAVDVTQQVLTQLKLEENKAELATALEQVRLSKEAAELGTFDMNPQTGIMHWDDRCRILFGISHHGPVTYNGDFIERLHPDDQQRIVAAVNRCFIKAESNGDYDVEYRTIGAEDGVERWVKAKGKVYFDNNEKPVRFIGSVLNITAQMTAMQKIEKTVEERTKELAQANERLQLINKELQRSNQNLEEFAYAASHDLKEPVRKIHIFTNQLRDQLADRVKDGELRAFERIETAASRMGNLIDDLLLYSHVSQVPHKTDEVDLNKKVLWMLEDLELTIQEKKAIVNVEDLPVIQGYRRQLQQLFQNLVSNALKYSKTDVPPRINISAKVAIENEKRYHVISVADNGIGFDPQYTDKIFQMFSRLHGRAEYSGTGVGLSIVKKVVENHHGFINVKSEIGVGSTFDIYLPA